MREHETILPAEPPARVALWAAANARWFRFAGALSRLLRGIARRGRRALAPRERPALPVFAGDGPPSWEPERVVREWRRYERVSASERATVVEVRRAS